MAREPVLVLDSLPSAARAALSEFQVVGPDDPSAMESCSAVMCWPWRVRRKLMEKLPKLRMIQTYSAGVDGVDFASIPEGARIYSNAGAFTESVAEHAWGLLLGVAKGAHVREVKSTPRMLRGKTLLVVGCGSIGSEVARLSKSLRMKTIGVSRSFAAPGVFNEKHPLAALGKVVSRADAMVLALPLSNTTRGVVGYGVLSKAKEALIVVNVGRGDSVKEKELTRWLRERPESRYATDVFWIKGGRESFSTSAWRLTNFVGTLHTSGTPLGEDLTGAKVAAAKNVRRFFKEGKALHEVDISEYI